MKLVELDIPEFSHSINQPEINNEIYENRLKRFKKDLRDNDFGSLNSSLVKYFQPTKPIFLFWFFIFFFNISNISIFFDLS